MPDEVWSVTTRRYSPGNAGYVTSILSPADVRTAGTTSTTAPSCSGSTRSTGGPAGAAVGDGSGAVAGAGEGDPPPGASGTGWGAGGGDAVGAGVGASVGLGVGAGVGLGVGAGDATRPAAGVEGCSTRIGSQRTPALAFAGICLAAPDATGSVSRVWVAAIGSDANAGSPNESPRPTSVGSMADPRMVPPLVPVDPARSSAPDPPGPAAGPSWDLPSSRRSSDAGSRSGSRRSHRCRSRRPTRG